MLDVGSGFPPVCATKTLKNANVCKSELEPVRDIQFLGVPASGSRESCSPRIQSL